MASDSIIKSTNKLFDYSLRISRRAKYAKLQIKPYGGLEVVLPRHYPKKSVPELLQRHASWIQQHLQRQQQQIADIVLPEEIHFAFEAKRYQVCYVGSQHPAALNESGELYIDSGDYQHCVDQLRQWVRSEAKRHLTPLLAEVSQQTGLGYQKISIRSQKSRWGSCSSRGTISLNDQLMFIAPETVKYLMIHELCHTRYMNHSPAYWNLVEQHCADFRIHERLLNRAKSTIPEWFLRDLYRG